MIRTVFAALPELLLSSPGQLGLPWESAVVQVQGVEESEDGGMNPQEAGPAQPSSTALTKEIWGGARELAFLTSPQ